MDRLRHLEAALGVDIVSQLQRIGGNVNIVVEARTAGNERVTLGELQVAVPQGPVQISVTRDVGSLNGISGLSGLSQTPAASIDFTVNDAVFSANTLPFTSVDYVHAAVLEPPSPPMSVATVTSVAGNKRRSIAATEKSRPSKRAATGDLQKTKTPKLSSTCGIFPENKAGLGLLERIWYGIYEGPMMANFFSGGKECAFLDDTGMGLDLSCPAGFMSHESFRELNGKCSAIFQFTRGVRILEIILQASWVDFFNARIEAIGREYPTNTPTENKMAALREAALAFSLSEKAMRNKLAIWQGYKRIKDIGGWPALIFAEDGVYTICKYRVGFKDPALFSSLRDLRAAIELAADTVQPTWRRFLRILQIETTPTYTGHPHTWQIAANGIPVPLSECNYKWIQHYKLIEESVVDMDLWDHDPRRVSDGPKFTCNECGEQQDDDPHNNRCRCFPELYGGIKMPAPVQIFDTGTKANGLVARFEFQQGRAIGEFVGLITRGKVGVDVMEGGGPEPEKKYQISQGKQGNFTRFINHSCMPNCQFERFVWMGLERIIAVALRTVEAGKEVTVDYSGVYWDGLEKICKCGEPCCRYSKPRTVSTSS